MGRFFTPDMVKAIEEITKKKGYNFIIFQSNELLEKEKRLSQENNSLIFENKDEFIELLSYGARVQSQISYERNQSG